MAVRVGDRAEAILADYRSGMGARVVARRNGVSPKTVRNVLERFGQPTRNPSQAATRYSLDPSPFEASVLSPEAAYFVGLLLTDGSILTPKQGGSRKVKLSLAAEDAAIVGELREFLRYTGPVRVYPSRRPCPLNGSPTQATVELLITSERLVEALARWGVVPRKTSTASADPRLSQSPDFWRGVVDGDGSVSSPQAARVGVAIVSGSPALASQFAEFCRSIRPDTTAGPVCKRPGQDGYLPLYTVSLARSQAAAVLTALYDRPGPAIARKRANAVAAIARQAEITRGRDEWVCQTPSCGSAKKFTARLCGTCHAADMKRRQKGVWRTKV